MECRAKEAFIRKDNAVLNYKENVANTDEMAVKI
jgi:hypothetical protein